MIDKNDMKILHFSDSVEDAYQYITSELERVKKKAPSTSGFHAFSGLK
jgi:hypothetical protein